MKTRRSLSLLLVFALVAALFALPASAAENRTVVKTFDVTDGMKATTYNIVATAGNAAGSSFSACTVEFSPEDYIPVVYTKNAGWSATLDKQYASAVNRYGYDVAAVVNGSFFTMDSGTPKLGNYGTLVGDIISNGRVMSAHAGYSGEVVAFMADGSMKVVNSYLTYKLVLNGTEVPNGIYYINKQSGTKTDAKWSDRFYYFDDACGTIADSNENNPGYEIICRKIDGTDLVVGGTMRAEIIEIKKDSSGSQFGGDSNTLSGKFELFVKSGSAYAKYVEGLKAGDLVEIGVSETVEESREIMESANSAIVNVGWLVKDGVDQTAINSTIGTHSVTLCARWTAFGVKADGSYVFFTSEGGSTGVGGALTLKDVAKNMMELGCVDVIRMDGGGSSAMYLMNDGSGSAGYLQSSTRSVGDCILIVKKSSLADDTATANLKAAIDDAAAKLENDSANVELKAAYDNAVAVYGDGTPASGSAIQALMKLQSVGDSSVILDRAITRADGISRSDYTAEKLQKVFDAYLYAKAVRATKNAAPEAVSKAANELNAALDDSVSAGAENIALKATVVSAPSYAPTYVGKVTDGITGTTAYDSKWAGFYQNFDSATGAPLAANNFSGDSGDIILDFGAVKSFTEFRTHVWGAGASGICPYVSIAVSVSNDGSSYTQVAITTDAAGLKGEPAWVALKASASGRYVKYTYTRAKNSGVFMFVSEVEAYESAAGETGVSEPGFVSGFNAKIESGKTEIFTPDVVSELTVSAANVRWSQTVILEWDETAQGYKVVVVKTPDGKDYGALGANQIALSVHNSQQEGDPDGSAVNRSYLATAKVGDFIEFHGVYVDKKLNCAGGFYKVVTADKFNKAYNGVLGDVDYNIPVKEEEGELTGKVNLVPDQIYETVSAGGGDASYKFEDGKMVVTSTGGWPCISTTYAKPLKVRLVNTSITINFSLKGGATSIRITTVDGNNIFLHRNFGKTLDAGSGDLITEGDYSITLDLADIQSGDDGVSEPLAALVPDENGYVTFTGVTIYSIGGAVVTINDISVDISEVKEEELGFADGSGLAAEGDYIMGLKAGVKEADFAKLLTGSDVTVAGVSAKTGLVGTGCTVTAAGKTYTVIVKGDIDGDGKVGVSDYTKIRLALLKITTLNKPAEAAAHVKTSADKAFGVRDYSAIRLFLLGMGTID